MDLGFFSEVTTFLQAAEEERFCGTLHFTMFIPFGVTCVLSQFTHQDSKTVKLPEKVSTEWQFPMT